MSMRAAFIGPVLALERDVAGRLQMCLKPNGAATAPPNRQRRRGQQQGL
jgi:hypothetical protein